MVPRDTEEEYGGASSHLCRSVRSIVKAGHVQLTEQFCADDGLVRPREVPYDTARPNPAH